MNKSDLVEAVASELGETKAAASRAVEAALRAIGEGVHNRGKVTISGFGTFERRIRPARTGVNPATGQKMTIPESVTVSFRASQALREGQAAPSEAVRR